MAKSLDSEAHEERERERIAGLKEEIETLRAELASAEAALAPLRAVVEDLRSWLFEQFDIFKTRDNVIARAVAASFKDVIVKLDDLSSLPADPPAPTQKG